MERSAEPLGDKLLLWPPIPRLQVEIMLYLMNSRLKLTLLANRERREGMDPWPHQFATWPTCAPPGAPAREVSKEQGRPKVY